MTLTPHEILLTLSKEFPERNIQRDIRMLELIPRAIDDALEEERRWFYEKAGDFADMANRLLTRMDALADEGETKDDAVTAEIYAIMECLETVARDEREACAKLAEANAANNLPYGSANGSLNAEIIAAAIRGRK